MTKIVTLKLDGNLQQQGFRAIAEIAPEGKGSILELSGFLPADAEFARAIQEHWRDKYRSLGETFPRGIKPKKITYKGSIKQRIADCRESGEELRDRFNRWLKSESFQGIDRRLREEFHRNEAIRLLIRTEDLLLKKLPWHLWDFVERYPQTEVALSSWEYQQSQPSKVSRDRAKIKILGIFGYSAGLDIEQDKQLLQNLPRTQTTLLVEPKLKEINDSLWEQPWDIIFFAGHGSTVEGEGRIEINPTESLTLDRVWYGLRKAVDAGLQLAIFNSCDGLGLLAQRLEDCQIPQMIVMREKVPDEVAQEFLRHFLTAFSGGKSLYLAAREARERLQGLENKYPCASWLPVIWQNPTAIPLSWLPQKSRRFPQWGKFVAAIALLAFATVGGYLFGGSHLAIWANELGIEQHKQGQLLQAQRYYKLATRLNPDYAQPYYNLGWLYDEGLGDREIAISFHQKAALRGLPEGAAEASRLLLLNRKPQAALQMTWHCLEQTKYKAVKAACLKNRGWVRWQQGRLPEAEKDLKNAIALVHDSPHSYCLLAQIQEANAQPKKALEAWRNTLKYSRYNIPEQDECIAMANQRLTGSKL